MKNLLIILAIAFVLPRSSYSQGLLTYTPQGSEQYKDISLFYSSGFGQDWIGAELGFFGSKARLGLVGAYNVSEFDLGIDFNGYLGGINFYADLHKQKENLPINIGLSFQAYGLFVRGKIGETKFSDNSADIVPSLILSHRIKVNNTRIHIMPFISAGYFGSINDEGYDSGDFLFRYGFESKLSQMLLSLTFEKASFVNRVDLNVGYIFGDDKEEPIPIVEEEVLPLIEENVEPNISKQNKSVSQTKNPAVDENNLKEQIVDLNNTINQKNQENEELINNIKHLQDELELSNNKAARLESELARAKQISTTPTKTNTISSNAIIEAPKEETIPIPPQTHLIQFFTSGSSTKSFPKMEALGEIVKVPKGNLTVYQVRTSADNLSRVQSTFPDAFIVD